MALTGRRGRGFMLDIAFTAPAGVTALLGASGSGKTSVLRAIAGLDRHAGTIRFGGEVWQNATCFVPADGRRVGYVVQGSSLLPHLTVAGNLAYAARRAEAGPFDHADVIARTDIAALLHRRATDLSGGEAQRASIARALLGQPRLLLMDEPVSALDTAGRAALLTSLAALFAATALPVLYVTHAAAEAAALAANLIHLHDGRIAAA